MDGKTRCRPGRGRLAWRQMKMRGIFSSLTVSPLWRRRGEKKWASRRTGEVCQLLVFLFSAKVWWWIGEGIDFLPHHFALGFGWKSHKLGASLCLSHSSLPFFLCEFSLLDNQTWEILRRFSLSLSRVLPFSLLPPLDWSVKKGKAGRS